MSLGVQSHAVDDPCPSLLTRPLPKRSLSRRRTDEGVGGMHGSGGFGLKGPRLRTREGKGLWGFPSSLTWTMECKMGLLKEGV